ncbi:beta-galactosidase [Opitutaceae bacterium TAV1]|nr:beta-galactosidase [Opitutaceae bacterium TAV1]
MKRPLPLILTHSFFLAILMTSAAANTAPTPLAGGLPAPLPASGKKTWDAHFTLENGTLLKNGAPFYPIGFVFGTTDAELAQARAMGANAVHFDIGWNTAPNPGELPDAALEKAREKIRLAAQWDIAVFPLLAGHYVPDWFQQKARDANATPLGNDGKKTGSWFPYSIHYPPLAEHIASFWRATSTMAQAEPNVISISLWNEPGYGGTWNRGDQFADYSPCGIDAWRSYLKKQYTSIAALNQAHATAFATWDDVRPPGNPAEHNRRAWLEWMRFGQDSFAAFFENERSIIRAAAPALLVNNKKQTNPWDRSTASSGTNWQKLGRSEDIFGINMYSGSLYGSRNILDAAASYADGKPVMIFEINTMPPSPDTRTPDTIRTQLWAPIAGGARGMFIFALIKNTEHGILGPKGADDEGRAEYTRVVTQISTHQRPLASPPLAGKIGVIYSTTAALQLTGDTVPRHATAAHSLWRNSHYQVDFIPEERSTDPALLARYALIVLPTAAVLPDASIAALRHWLETDTRRHLWAFSDTLSRTPDWEPLSLPPLLGINTRKPPIGDRATQQISNVDPTLENYFESDCQITGVEMVTTPEGDTSAIIPGAEVKTKTDARVLAWNSDSYPTILQTGPGGRVIYCAFNSESIPALRNLVEGITRDIIGIKPEARFVNPSSGTTTSAIITGIRQDWQDTDTRYLIAINTAYRPHKTAIELPQGWRVENELLHSASPGSASSRPFQLKARDVYLFTLKKHK